MPDITVENLPLFLVFVVPGFIALKAYGLLIPSERREAGYALLEAVTYGMVNAGLMSWVVLLLWPRRNDYPTLYWAGIFFVLVVSPCLLAYGLYRFRISHLGRRWMLDPSPQAWDFFFSQRRACFLLLHLKSGKMLGGFFGERSSASGFPSAPDLFVEEVWRVDEYGRFVDKVSGTGGCLIGFSECERIEVFTAEEGA